MATFLNSFENRAICIPLIQRDYVQSLSTAIIESFVDQLIDVLSDESCSESMNLNYIYGIDHSQSLTKGFEPVDGQQRLTTLWLFCLYINQRLIESNIESTFNVKIIYQSREYANAFCQEISQHSSWTKYVADFDKHIINQHWFISDWEEDTSVFAMVKALAVIARKLNRVDNDRLLFIWKRLNDIHCPVAFSFYPTDTLGDDIYIKMNGRGRSLTTFENLKSWLDEKINCLLPDRCQYGNQNGVSRQFANRWKYEMDNAWTNLFWSNRETGSYEIDDMQQRLFYNLLYLYWCFEDKRRLLPLDCDIEELALLLNMSIENVNRVSVTEAILTKIIKTSDYSLPLYILDKINLCPLKFFLWFHKVLNGLCSINNRLKSISDKEIFFWGKSIDNNSDISRTLLFQILMSESGQKEVSKEKLALGYALCKFACFHDKTVTSLMDWMYRCRNLILNTPFNNSEFSKYLQSISSLFEECMREEINVVLKQDGLKLKHFPEKYIRLEQYKSEIILSENQKLIEVMKKLENMSFFVGSILCLPLLISSQEAIENPSKFIKICHILSTILTSEGPLYGDKFRRALLYFAEPSYGFGGWEGNLWSFLNGKNDWQWFFNDTETDKKIKLSNRKALKGVVDYLLHFESDEFENQIDELISIDGNIDDDYPRLGRDDWRYPFVYNAMVFKFMDAKCCRCNLPYDIVLSKSTVIRKNTDHISLQAFLLYREYKDGIRSLGEGWEIELYKRENSCLVFKKRILRITVEFSSIENKENAYSMRIYLINENNVTHSIEHPYLKMIVDNFSPDEYIFDENDGIRMNSLTYKQVADHLNNFVR